MNTDSREVVLLRSVLDHVLEGIISFDEQGIIKSFNPAAQHIFGYGEQEVLGQNVRQLMPEPDADEPDTYLSDYLRPGTATVLGIDREVSGRRKEGNTFAMELAIRDFELDGQRHFTGIVRDVTERKRLEEKLRQSQKLEAIGRLTGGIAHDFNNMLMIVLGYSELLLDKLTADDPQRDSLRQIQHAAERAAALTRQLLAFSRQQVLSLKVLDLTDVIIDAERILRRVIGEDVQLRVKLNQHLGPVRADPDQLVQVLLNLAINARDAMPTGGELIIETNDIELDSSKTVHLGLRNAGQYAMLIVKDTGCGMSPEVQARAFEPFFTTKPMGQGTGLGLATVYGIVTQSEGGIEIRSGEEQGTAFAIYLPIVPGLSPAAVLRAEQLPRPGKETILLVEDEAGVRDIALLGLASYGYNVLVASDGPEALNLARMHAGEIDLLVTDVVMPLMSGRELAERLQARLPDIKVLYMSGYTDDSVFRHGLIMHSGVSYLQKPFPPTALARAVRKLLDTGTAKLTSPGEDASAPQS